MTVPLAADALLPLFTQGFARVPESRWFEGPEIAGLCRCHGDTVTATPELLHLASRLANPREAPALLFSVAPRIRDAWLRIQAARLADLGRRNEVEALCAGIETLGPAAEALRHRLSDSRLEPTPYSALEVAVFGAPADQPAAGPGLLRVLSLTASLVEGNRAPRLDPLQSVHPVDPRENWVSGRLLQAPGNDCFETGDYVLSGQLGALTGPLMDWVLKTPWATLLGHLVFMAEAWAAERQGGVSLQLPQDVWDHYAAPPRVHVVVTFADGREVLCGTLGELFLKALDALGMALVPQLRADGLDARMGPVIGRMLQEGVWSYRTVVRPEYVIGSRFSDDCYRGIGHRYIYLAGEQLAEVLRSTCVSWARTLTERSLNVRATQGEAA